MTTTTPTPTTDLDIDGAYIPGSVMEFSMEEARERGFFLEDAISEQDAIESTQGLVFLEADALLAAIELPYKEQVAAGLYGRVPYDDNTSPDSAIHSVVTAHEEQ